MRVPTRRVPQFRRAAAPWMKVRTSMAKPPPLDYERPASDVTRTTAPLFWIIYLICLILGLSVLEPILATALWGRPGDQGVAFFVLSSAATVTVMTVAGWWRIRGLPASRGVTVAIVAGLLSFVPAATCSSTYSSRKARPRG